MLIHPQSKYLIGIDLGTSSAKTVIIDQCGQLITWAGEEYGISSPQTDWAEQDPEIWISAVLKTIRTALDESRINPHHIAGIGLAGQMHGLVCLDETVILYDQPSSGQIDAVKFNFNKLKTKLAMKIWQHG